MLCDLFSTTSNPRVSQTIMISIFRTLFTILLTTPVTMSSEIPHIQPQGPVPEPFTIRVDQGLIDEARSKAKLYRATTDLVGDSNKDWSDGPPAANMTTLAQYWAEAYDWNKVQDDMNTQFQHFKLTIPKSSGYQADLPVHFVHERSNAEDATPLLLLHGWPSTHLEWEKVIKPLVSSKDAGHKTYHIVAPDLPGFGFSPAPTIPGLGPREMGRALHSLMTSLGYQRYGIVTTDLGWQMGMWMVQDVGESIIGHMADFFIPQPTPSDFERLQRNETAPEEAEYLKGLQGYMNGHAAYATIQAQAPLTLAQAMTDSPVGYAGWIWHLMNTASDGYAYSLEEVITSTMMLWVGGPYGNLRTYKEFYKVTTRTQDRQLLPLIFDFI